MECIKVVNLKCGGCEESIKKALSEAGVTNVNVSVEKGKVCFVGDREKVVKILAKIGYPEEGSKEAQSILKKTQSYATCAEGAVLAGLKDKRKRGKKFWGIIIFAFVIILFVVWDFISML